MSGDRGSVSGVLVCWSLDLGSTLIFDTNKRPHLRYEMSSYKVKSLTVVDVRSKATSLVVDIAAMGCLPLVKRMTNCCSKNCPQSKSHL